MLAPCSNMTVLPFISPTRTASKLQHHSPNQNTGGHASFLAALLLYMRTRGVKCLANTWEAHTVNSHTPNNRQLDTSGHHNTTPPAATTTSSQEELDCRGADGHNAAHVVMNVLPCFPAVMRIPPHPAAQSATLALHHLNTRGAAAVPGCCCPLHKNLHLLAFHTPLLYLSHPHQSPGICPGQTQEIPAASSTADTSTHTDPVCQGVTPQQPSPLPHKRNPLQPHLHTLLMHWGATNLFHACCVCLHGVERIGCCTGQALWLAGCQVNGQKHCLTVSTMQQGIKHAAGHSGRHIVMLCSKDHIRAVNTCAFTHVLPAGATTKSTQVQLMHHALAAWCCQHSTKTAFKKAL
jgi:hypothetical protein